MYIIEPDDSVVMCDEQQQCNMHAQTCTLHKATVYRDKTRDRGMTIITSMTVIEPCHTVVISDFVINTYIYAYFSGSTQGHSVVND